MSKHPNKSLDLVTVYATEQNKHLATGKEMHVSKEVAERLVMNGMATDKAPAKAPKV